MSPEIGFSEFCLLAILALVLVSPKDIGHVYAVFKKWKGKFYKMKFDLEDRLMAESDDAHKLTVLSENRKQSAWIANAILDFDLYRQAAKVAAFYPLKNEPDIRPVLSKLAGEGRLLLPITFDEGRMEFVEIGDLEKDLVEGRFHVREPRRDLPVYRGQIPLALVPGVEFSRDGGRHGHGKGFYDRFLARHPETIKCGIAFREQVFEKPLALEPHDIPMNYIVAPKTDPNKEIPHVEKATV